MVSICSSLLGHIVLLGAGLVMHPGRLQAATDSEAPLPSIEVSAHANCDGVSRRIALVRDQDRIALDLPPQSEWMGWSRESGVDLVIHTTDPRSGELRALDSAPARYADDPLWLRADDRGRASLRLQVLGHSHPRGWSIELTCVESLPEVEQARTRAVFDLAHRMHGWFEHGGQDRLLAWVKAYASLLVDAELDPRTRLWLDFQWATAARRGGFLLEAHGWFSRAHAHAQALQRDELAVAAELGLGKTELNLGRASAEARLRGAAQRATELGMPYPGLVAAQDLCVLQRLAARASEAITCYREVVERSQTLEEWADFANAQSNLATALVSQGDLNGARRALDAALQAADRYDSERARWTAAQLLAKVQGWSGEYLEALATLDQALRMLDPNRPVERAGLLASLAGIYLLMGESHRALQIHQDVIADLRARGQSVRARWLTLRAAEVELRLGLPDAAVRRLREWLRLDDESSGNATRLGRLGLALALGELGAMDEARIEYAKIGHGSEAWDWSRRLRALDLELRLGLRADIESSLEAAATEALAQKHDLAHVEAVALALHHRPRGDPAQAPAWFDESAAQRIRRAAQLLRSPELRSGLIGRLHPLASHRALHARAGRIEADLVRDLLEPLEELRAIEQHPAEATDQDALAMLERSVAMQALDIDSGGDRFGDAATALAWHASVQRAPGLPQAPSNHPLPRLAADEVLIYPVLDRHRGSLFVGQGGRWQAIVGLDAAEVRRATQALLTGLESGRIARVQLDQQLAAARQALGWSRIEFAEPPRRLLVVATGTLGALPWELLPVSTSGASDPGAVPELVLLQSLRPAPADSGIAQVLTIGPNLTGSGPLHALAAAQGEPDEIVRLWSGTLAARRVASSPSGLIQALQTADALVHVAGHAQAGGGLAEDQGLWIGDIERPEFFSALRLAQAGSRASLVVLNACETGRAYGPDRIGLAGAAGSLVNGGAGGVIATRWPVADRTAQRFAVLLHQQLGKTPDPAHALRAARDALRGLPAHRHASEWAAWFLIQSGPTSKQPD